MKNSFLTVTDLFCGAGDSSQGVRRASVKQGGGLELKLAMNHICDHAHAFPKCLNCDHSKEHDIDQGEKDGCDKEGRCYPVGEDYIETNCVKTEEK